MVANDKIIRTEEVSNRANVDETRDIRNDGDDDSSKEDQLFCRLCYGTKYDDSSLIEPCSCKGTMAKVHRQCLQKWLNHIGSTKCELCLFEFKCEEKLRYGLFRSISIWMRHNGRRRYILHDFSLFLTMNIITLSMIILLLQAIHHIYNDNVVKDALPVWYFVALCLAAALWIAIYFLTFAVFFNTQIRPWYKWWRSVKKITLLTN